EKGLHRSLVGRVYRAGAILVRPERLAAYGAVVGDTASPVFPVTLIRELFVKLVDDPEFNGDLSRMVHGEQVFSYRRPVRPWDLVSPRARVRGIEDKASGQVLGLGQEIYCEGELLLEMETRLFFRGDARSEKPPGAGAPPARPAPDTSFAVTGAPDFPKRYAEVSGDTNPIHLDEALARSVGFKGVIQHGLGTLALVVAKLPRPLSRLAVRFAKPVYPGEALTTTVWRKGNALEFETANPAGDVVLANGQATVGAD
ncbi:MAG TPA: MaoC/PaaZ C-terminal domain-containing protein, partial [Planctomycetota bacterium]|nr:MaoC/PaaZ C-terminal domain-containing protein [Planctomycetota bacterium]